MLRVLWSQGQARTYDKKSKTKPLVILFQLWHPMRMPGTLWIVATPIGNLEDLTMRAARVLREADLVVCEDTRVTSKLLKALEISKKTLSLHEHSDAGKIRSLIEMLERGQSIAYVSDAGTPGVNDPGGKLCAAAFHAGFSPMPIPGASALSGAISVCGFPMERFSYVGFAPHKKGRETFFRELAEREEATVFFESTHRIEKAIVALQKELDPKRLVCICRELTKMHETILRGPIDEIAKKLHDSSLKGEFVIIIAPVNFYE